VRKADLARRGRADDALIALVILGAQPAEPVAHQLGETGVVGVGFLFARPPLERPEVQEGRRGGRTEQGAVGAERVLEVAVAAPIPGCRSTRDGRRPAAAARRRSVASGWSTRRYRRPMAMPAPGDTIPCYLRTPVLRATKLRRAEPVRASGAGVVGGSESSSWWSWPAAT
jgi:hypothetical protein